MKNLMLVLVALLYCQISYCQTQIAFYPKPTPGTAPFSNPELIKSYLLEKGLKVIDVGEGPVGFGKDHSGGKVSEAVLIKEANLPRDTYQYEIFTFICNYGDGCLGGSGGWVRGEYRYFQDLTFCKINEPHIIPKEDGTTTIRGYFINWSDCDRRRGKMFVAYKTKQMVLEELKKDLGETR